MILLWCIYCVINCDIVPNDKPVIVMILYLLLTDDIDTAGIYIRPGDHYKWPDGEGYSWYLPLFGIIPDIIGNSIVNCGKLLMW